MLTPLLHNADADLDADIKNMALPGSADVKRLEANGPCFISLVWSRWTILSQPTPPPAFRIKKCQRHWPLLPVRPRYLVITSRCCPRLYRPLVLLPLMRPRSCRIRRSTAWHLTWCVVPYSSTLHGLTYSINLMVKWGSPYFNRKATSNISPLFSYTHAVLGS